MDAARPRGAMAKKMEKGSWVVATCSNGCNHCPTCMLHATLDWADPKVKRGRWATFAGSLCAWYIWHLATAWTVWSHKLGEVSEVKYMNFKYMFVKPMESVAFSCFLLFHEGCRFKAQFLEMLLHCNICTQPGTKADRERVGDVIVEAQNFRWFDGGGPSWLTWEMRGNLCFRGHVRKRIRWCEELKEAFGKSQRPSCPTNCRRVHGDTIWERG